MILYFKKGYNSCQYLKFYLKICCLPIKLSSLFVFLNTFAKFLSHKNLKTVWHNI